MEKWMNIISQSVQKGNGKLKVMVKDTIDIQGLKPLLAVELY